MRQVFARITAVLLGLLPFTGIAEAAQKVFVQGPCASGNQSCRTFYSYSQIPLIRTFAFTAPRAGIAQVTFQGTLSCTSANNVDTYVDLAAQIVTSTTAAARANAPGGARHTVVLPRVAVDATLSPTVEINLASSRTLSFAGGGQKTVYFRITKLRMDEATACNVYGSMFTVLYLS